MRAPDRTRTAVIGALFSAGVVVTMATTAATHQPEPDPEPTAVTAPAVGAQHPDRR